MRCNNYTIPMRMKLYTLLCISFFLLFTACNQDDDPVPPEKVSRTVLAYIMADNSLSNYASLDIDEMMVGMAAVDASDNNLLVYVDDNSREGSPSYNPPTLFRLSKDKSGTVLKEVVREYKEQVSTDASVMEEVMKRTFAEYPAESYGLVVRSHGEGWIPSPLPIVKKTSTRWIGEDSGHHLNIADMAFIFEKVGCHLDFILFDACFGQSVEVAYELHNYVDYIIGSPTEIPGPGASYDKVVPAMFAAANVGIEIGKAYYDPYAALYTGDRPSRFEDPWTAGVSISVIDCAALENLASVTKQTLSSDPILLNLLLNSNIYNYDRRAKSSSSYIGYYDMRQLMQYLSSDIDNWTSAANNAIIYWKATPKNYSSYIGMFPISQGQTCGVSHYIPFSLDSQAAAAYRSTAWYTAAGLNKIGW